LAKPTRLPFLYILDTAVEPRVSWLFCDGPVVFFTTSQVKSGVLYSFPADNEGFDIDHLIEILKVGFFVQAFGLEGQLRRVAATPTLQKSVACQKIG
jgi:hypothetical protein